MPWIPLTQVGEHLGDDRKEAFRLAARDGEIDTGWRQSDGSLYHLGAHRWRTGVMIDWPNGRLECLTTTDNVFVPVEVDLVGLLEIFPPRADLTPARKVGRKPKPPGQTIDERRLAMLESGHTMERIADQDQVDIDVVRRSLARGRKRRAAGQ
jgi:hypothetical protein